MAKGKRSQKEQEELERTKREMDLSNYDIVDENDEEGNETADVETSDVQQVEDFKSFDKLVSEFQANEGWVHVSLQKDKQPKVKISKYRPAEFDRDEIAKIYGGGLYYYDLRDKYGKRVAMDEQRYANNESDYTGQPQIQSNGNDSLSQALSLVEKLTNDIAELKAEINNNKSTQTQDSIVALISAMNEQNKAQQTQNMELFKALLLQQTAQHPKQEQNTMKDFLAMFATIKSMIPEQKEEKTSIADTIALVNAINDLKQNGVDTSNRSLADIVKDFLTDGSLVNIISSFKKKPIVPPTDNTPTAQPQLPQNTSVSASQQEQPQNPTVSPEEQAINTVVHIFKQHEKSLLQLKMKGYTPDDTGNTILNLGALAPDLEQVFYIAFSNASKMHETLMKNTVLFSNDSDYVKGICLYIHNALYEQETETPEQETPQTVDK